MKDNIIFLTCVQILLYWLIDYFDGHGFGMEATVATLNALALCWLHRKDKS